MTGSYVTWEDICRWRREKRENILRYVHAFEGFGGILYDRQENKTLHRCPFLRSESDCKYSCSIHETKPFVCAVYPTFYDHAGHCPYCGYQVRDEDFSCLKCGGILAFDPRSVMDDCPGTRKVLVSLLRDMDRNLRQVRVEETKKSA
jgi:Fe-S-cluster containining protein